MSQVPIVASVADLSDAIKFAQTKTESRWYVASRAQALGRAQDIPEDWNIPAVVTSVNADEPVETPDVASGVIKVGSVDLADAEIVLAGALDYEDYGDEGDALVATAFTEDQRVSLAKKGEAMEDGSFPIRNRTDLQHAIRAVGRAKDPEAAKSHIKKRAKDLGLESALPDSYDAVTASADPVTEESQIASAKQVLRERVAASYQIPLTAAGLEHKAAKIGRAFDEAMHPRGKDGKFIVKGGRVITPSGEGKVEKVARTGITVNLDKDHADHVFQAKQLSNAPTSHAHLGEVAPATDDALAHRASATADLHTKNAAVVSRLGSPGAADTHAQAANAHLDAAEAHRAVGGTSAGATVKTHEGQAAIHAAEVARLDAAREPKAVHQVTATPGGKVIGQVHEMPNGESHAFTTAGEKTVHATPEAAVSHLRGESALGDPHVNAHLTAVSQSANRRSAIANRSDTVETHMRAANDHFEAAGAHREAGSHSAAALHENLGREHEGAAKQIEADKRQAEITQSKIEATGEQAAHQVKPDSYYSNPGSAEAGHSAAVANELKAKGYTQSTAGSLRHLTSPDGQSRVTLKKDGSIDLKKVRDDGSFASRTKSYEGLHPGQMDPASVADSIDEHLARMEGTSSGGSKSWQFHNTEKLRTALLKGDIPAEDRQAAKELLDKRDAKQALRARTGILTHAEPTSTEKLQQAAQDRTVRVQNANVAKLERAEKPSINDSNLEPMDQHMEAHGQSLDKARKALASGNLGLAEQHLDRAAGSEQKIREMGRGRNQDVADNLASERNDLGKEIDQARSDREKGTKTPKDTYPARRADNPYAARERLTPTGEMSRPEKDAAIARQKTEVKQALLDRGYEKVRTGGGAEAFQKGDHRVHIQPTGTVDSKAVTPNGYKNIGGHLAGEDYNKSGSDIVRDLPKPGAAVWKGGKEGWVNDPAKMSTPLQQAMNDPGHNAENQRLWAGESDAGLQKMANGSQGGQVAEGAKEELARRGNASPIVGDYVTTKNGRSQYRVMRNNPDGTSVVADHYTGSQRTVKTSNLTVNAPGKAHEPLALASLPIPGQPAEPHMNPEEAAAHRAALSRMIDARKSELSKPDSRGRSRLNAHRDLAGLKMRLARHDDRYGAPTESHAQATSAIEARTPDPSTGKVEPIKVENAMNATNADMLRRAVQMYGSDRGKWSQTNLTKAAAAGDGLAVTELARRKGSLGKG